METGMIVQKCDIRNDVVGFFSKTFTVPIGTVAAVYEDGKSLGTMENGSYTIETFSQRFLSWSRKNTEIYLLRSSDITLDFSFEDIATSEYLDVAVKSRLTLSIEDAAMFIMNRLGTDQRYSESQLRADIEPALLQAVREIVATYSIRDFQHGASNDASGVSNREKSESAILRKMQLAFERYGLKFTAVKWLDVRHDEYDANRQKLGEIWLMRDGLESQQQLHELDVERRVQELDQQEQDYELRLLSKEVRTDYDEGKLATMQRRAELRRRWRDIIQSDRFDKICSQNDLENMLSEQENASLVRDDERTRLLDTFAKNKDDRDSARRHLLERIAIEQAFDLDELRSRLAHVQKLESLDRELELAGKTESVENVRWVASLEKEKRDRAAAFDAMMDTQRAQRESGGFDRDEELKDLLHRQKLQRIENEIKIDTAMADDRIERIALERQKLEDEREERRGKARSDEFRAFLAAGDEVEEHQHQRKAQSRKQELDSELARERIHRDADLQVERTRLEERERAAQQQAEQQALLARTQERGMDRLENIAMSVASAIGGHAIRAVNPSASSPPPEDAARKSGVRVFLCRACRTEVEESARFCPNCGESQ